MPAVIKQSRPITHSFMMNCAIGPSVIYRKRVFTFSRLHWLNVLWSFGSRNLWLSVCLSSAVCQNYSADFNLTYPNEFPRSSCARLWFSSLASENKNAKALKLHSFIQYCPLVSTVILLRITVKITNHADIRDQQVKIYKNPCFDFKFPSVDFLTFYLTVISTESWWRKTLEWNSKPSHILISSNF